MPEAYWRFKNMWRHRLCKRQSEVVSTSHTEGTFENMHTCVLSLYKSIRHPCARSGLIWANFRRRSKTECSIYINLIISNVNEGSRASQSFMYMRHLLPDEVRRHCSLLSCKTGAAHDGHLCVYNSDRSPRSPATSSNCWNLAFSVHHGVHAATPFPGNIKTTRAESCRSAELASRQALGVAPVSGFTSALSSVRIHACSCLLHS